MKAIARQAAGPNWLREVLVPCQKLVGASWNMLLQYGFQL